MMSDWAACFHLQSQYKGCCCEKCMTAPRFLRPRSSQKPFPSWHHIASSEDLPLAEAAVVTGRGAGWRRFLLRKFDSRTLTNFVYASIAAWTIGAEAVIWCVVERLPLMRESHRAAYLDVSRHHCKALQQAPSLGAYVIFNDMQIWICLSLR